MEFLNTMKIPSLCTFFAFSNFWATWALLFVLASISISLSSGITFLMYYVNPTYEQWRWKTNPKYPSPESVRMEIFKTIKGTFIVTFCPSLALYLAKFKLSKAYCGITDEYDLQYNVIQFFVLWLVTDFYEFFYHWIGHTFDAAWDNHKSHHKFSNPSPFAVIADDAIDQLFRSAPLLVFPLIAPVNIEVMFAQWAIIFYMYGTYLHWGYESQYISAHNSILNTAYDHYLHHSRSIKNKAIRTGFFFKIWDNIFGSVQKDACICVRCQHAAGKRTEKEFATVKIPDYSVLLKPSFWFTTNWYFVQ
mmetsp:Transcript_660/g.792  ORF Transcript_660/g.792 Transcript_660/m.792 type:complete len:305 (-) Transcript_660:137-1051(-)|eukprot:CAMPEP_0204868052 /NCGR_PEP_ID=MMETSP1348-20121228/25459_1 /ASSEMBLY_ACC=CAM_ASM_000700 /TAXON_ID=215587 /ORGANISM="Aplanochytrium stocchinoi, Strain GSBS06" /LENGTH=304 /DNA_ID=CAMNT_0052020835 /DNA_START=199 /DNA_END=1113 /DNA_ORIENTATION=+